MWSLICLLHPPARSFKCFQTAHTHTHPTCGRVAINVATGGGRRRKGEKEKTTGEGGGKQKPLRGWNPVTGVADMSFIHPREKPLRETSLTTNEKVHTHPSRGRVPPWKTSPPRMESSSSGLGHVLHPSKGEKTTSANKISWNHLIVEQPCII